ncbi:MAG: Hsp20/alpha crystallin family protein [Rubrobacteraceae bacterium]
MSGKRHNPFRGIIDSISETNRIQQHWMTGEGTQEDQRRTHATAWVPATDIFLSGEDLVIRCEIAGVDERDIDVSVTGGILVISGDRTNDTRDEDVVYYVRERFYGNFRRTMTLPEGVNESQIRASYENGMLEITIEGGANAASPRRIQIG